jgi:hypothetical protein
MFFKSGISSLLIFIDILHHCIFVCQTTTTPIHNNGMMDLKALSRLSVSACISCRIRIWGQIMVLSSLFVVEFMHYL